MPLKYYSCPNCGNKEEEFFHTTEEIPIEVPCLNCEYFMEMPIRDNLCQSEQFWGHNDPRGKD